MSTSEHRFDGWATFEKAVALHTAAFHARWRSPSAVPFFRGHSSTTYQLAPSLLRPAGDRWYSPSDEANLFYEFRSRGGSLLDARSDDWEVLFCMQHFGVPTRLLDWSESFAVALFFALSGGDDCDDVDLWFLDPYDFNRASCGVDEILDVHADLKTTYVDYFVEPSEKPEWRHAIAIYPQRRSARLLSQAAAFTLHSSRSPLNALDVPGLSRFTLPSSGRTDAALYLQLAGVNEQTVYADLTGLARLLGKRFRPSSDCSWPAETN